MGQRERENYMKEIQELKARAVALEVELGVYDTVYERVYDVFTKVVYPQRSKHRKGCKTCAE